MSNPVRWGIWGTGGIARQVAADFPLTKNSQLRAVASRSLDRAQRFANEFGVIGAYQGLDRLLADRDIDVVYIATPHRCHAPDALACLRAGKPVLCEKPFTLNLAEAEQVVAAARAHNLFCMEAMWTRFFPAVIAIKRLIAQGAIGNIRLIQGNFGYVASPGHDVLAQPVELGGGALLDIGVYPVSLAHHLLGEPGSMQGAAVLTPGLADEQSVYQLAWPNGALAYLASTLRAETPNDFLIAGDLGVLHIPEPLFRPHRFTLRRYAQRVPPAATSLGKIRQHQFPWDNAEFKRLYRLLSPLVDSLRRGRMHRHLFPGNGYQFQFDEVARCLAEGRTESPIMPLDDTLAVMRTMDRLRAQWAPKTEAAS